MCHRPRGEAPLVVADCCAYRVTVTENPVVAVVGEALVDLVPAEDGRYRPVPGGSPANVAVGLARLDVPVSLLARLGAGGFGAVVRRHLESNGVGLDLSIAAGELPTLAVVSLDDDGSATYDFYAEGTADWAWTDAELPVSMPASVSALCAGSIAAARPPGADPLRRLLERERARGAVTVVLDPNLRPALLGSHADARARWRDLVALGDVVKVSDEDLAWLEPGADPRDVARDWAGAGAVRAGPALVVVTRGGEGAFAITRTGTEVNVDAVPVEVVDTVGAGDAFTAGLVDGLRLAGLLGGDRLDALASVETVTLRAALHRAGTVAALTCTRPGADPPTLAELSAAGLGTG